MRSLHRAICLGMLVCAPSCSSDMTGTGPAATETDVDDVSAQDGTQDAPVADQADASPQPESPDAGAPEAKRDAGVVGDGDGDGAPGTDAGAEPEPMPDPRPPGSLCMCDADCVGGPVNRGLCVSGLCMTAASAVCSGPGSRAECALGGTCWGIENYDGYVCWPDCFSFMCEAACDPNGHCVPTADLSCNAACGVLCESRSP